MSKPKAEDSYIVRTIVDVQSEWYDHVIPKGATGCVVEVYETSGKYGYAVDIHPREGEYEAENVTLEEDQFEVIEEHDIPLSDPPGPRRIPPRKDTSETES